MFPNKSMIRSQIYVNDIGMNDNTNRDDQDD